MESWNSAGLWWSLQGGWASPISSRAPCSTPASAQCRQGWAAKAAQSFLLPELKLPKASAAQRDRATTVFPVSLEWEGKRPTKAGTCLCPLPSWGQSHPS